MELPSLFAWWLTFFLIGIINFPLSVVLFRRFFDLGYGFSKTLGLFIITYLVFLGSIFRLVPFGRVFVVVSLLILLATNLVLVSKDFWALLKRNRKIIIFQEILFSAGLFFWSLIRGYAPDIRGLEKFMDFGFINSILRSKFFPPVDMWQAGEKINYYWFGHLMSSVPIKLSGVIPSIAFNLMLGTILGILLMGAFSLVSTVIKSLSKKYTKKAISLGIVSAILVCFAGNFHTPIFLIKKGFSIYWYPDATRFIGYFPETQDKTIHEFPIYSFVVSDLHAHLLSVPLTILFLAILYSLISSSGKISHKILAAGLVLGGTIATNTWDFASYSLVAGFVFLINGILKKKSLSNIIWSTLARTVSICTIGVVAFLSFLVNFSSIAQGARLVHSHSYLWQLGVLWGFPAIMTILFLVVVLKLGRKKLKSSDEFILALLTASWILIVIPELVYVKDIYISSHYRANTMFKLTYSAYVMFYISSGYIAMRVLSASKKVWRFIAVGFFSILFTSLLIYPFLAINSYYGGLKKFHGLSGETWVKNIYPDSYAAIVWLNKNVPEPAVILEAPGNSYTDNNLISSYTGLPTVQGWFVHEWLWRGSAEEPQKRVNDITTIYQTKNAQQAEVLLETYRVRYVIVGDAERERFSPLGEEKFLKIGKRVFSSGDTSIYLVGN